MGLDRLFGAMALLALSAGGIALGRRARRPQYGSMCPQIVGKDIKGAED